MIENKIEKAIHPTSLVLVALLNDTLRGDPIEKIQGRP